jgi:hypothetical protein
MLLSIMNKTVFNPLIKCFLFDLPNQGGLVVCHEKTLCASLHAVAFTGRSLMSDLASDLGKVIERWRRKVTGLRMHLAVLLGQPDRQTGVRSGSFVASFACSVECP